MSQKRNALQEAIDRALRIPNNNSQSSENNQFLEEESVIMSNDIFRKRPILGRRVLVPMNRDNMDSKADVYVAENGEPIERSKTYESLVLRYESNIVVFTHDGEPITFEAIRKVNYEEVLNRFKATCYNYI